MKKKSRLQRMKRFQKALYMELREHRSSFTVYFILRLLVIVIMILQFFNGNYENLFLCILTLILLVLPSFFQVNFRIELPTTLEIIILLFIFSAEILGEISAYYIKIPIWDTLLHTINGFLAAAIGFSLAEILNRQDKVKFELSPLFMAIVGFSFSMTIGVVWEFFEFGMDMFFGLDMQKDTIVHSITSVMLDPAGGNHPASITGINEVYINGKALGLGGYLDIGLIDTMKDLFVNFIGALIFSILGYFYVKNLGKHGVANRFIPRSKHHDNDYLRILKEADEKEP